MLERNLILTRITASNVPPRGTIQSLDIDYASMPGILDHLGADRRVTSHTFDPINDGSGDWLLTLFAERATDS